MTRTRLCLALPALALTLACVKQPPILVYMRGTATQRAAVHGRPVAVGALQSVDLKDYKRAFEKKYGSEAAFKEAFVKGLQALLPATGADGVRLELARLVVDEYTTPGYWSTVGGGPNMPPVSSYHGGTAYALVGVHFKVLDASGATLLEGRAEAQSAKAEFLHPNQSRLANAVEEAQRQVADFLTGKMAAENIGMMVEMGAPREKKDAK